MKLRWLERRKRRAEREAEFQLHWRCKCCGFGIARPNYHFCNYCIMKGHTA